MPKPTKSSAWGATGTPSPEELTPSSEEELSCSDQELDPENHIPAIQTAPASFMHVYAIH